MRVLAESQSVGYWDRSRLGMQVTVSKPSLVRASQLSHDLDLGVQRGENPDFKYHGGQD